MGASMTGIIEWTEDAQDARQDDPTRILGEPRWQEDDLKGVLFEVGKEYEFFAAIAGVRNRFGKPPLIKPRGVPSRLSSLARRHFDDYGSEVAGWLHLSEIRQCIRHMAADPFYMDFDLDVALQFMQLLVDRFNDAHVRLVFNIDSP
jgi:hypothetical protein